MNIARSSFATILLRDGRVFIAGGDNKKDDVFDSCELFNPSNNDCVICKTFMKQKETTQQLVYCQMEILLYLVEGIVKMMSWIPLKYMTY